MVDRDFGLAAWQPAWLLLVPAFAALAARRPRGAGALGLTLLAGWLMATFVALTMQGWWFPGRQLVVVLPAAVLAIAWWAGGGRRRLAAVMGLGTVGVFTYAWLLVEGLSGRVDLGGRPPDDGQPALPRHALRAARLPARDRGHMAAALGLVRGGARRRRRDLRPRAGRAPAAGPPCSGLRRAAGSGRPRS